MSSNRTYNLRARHGVGIATQSSVLSQEIPPFRPSIPASRALAPRTEGGMNAIRSDSMTALRTYSDVVASRPPSPVKEISVLPSGSPVEGAIRASEPDRLINETLITEINNDVEIERFTSSDSGDIATRKNELPWTTVRRRRVGMGRKVFQEVETFFPLPEHIKLLRELPQPMRQRQNVIHGVDAKNDELRRVPILRI
ncbi:hypothetical protein BYT27DRAFT_7340026 [Phlegmacium glaucopus]|nr:hypothetical protein BYT27DRAFT_7340026 [Phlegmacium glaucopus]